MTASEVEAEATSTTAATAMTPMKPMTTPMSAVRIGSPAAATAPNVTSRMRNPMATPMTSGSSEILGTDPGYTEPENSVCTPASRDGATAALSASRVDVLTLALVAAYWTRASAARPPAAMLPLRNGSLTTATCGTFLRLARAASMLVRYTLSVTFAGPLVAKTTCVWPPAKAGIRWASRSVACCDWAPGTVKLSTLLPPLPTARAITPASRTSHPNTTNRRPPVPTPPTRYINHSTT